MNYPLFSISLDRILANFRRPSAGKKEKVIEVEYLGTLLGHHKI